MMMTVIEEMKTIKIIVKTLENYKMTNVFY